MSVQKIAALVVASSLVLSACGAKQEGGQPAKSPAAATAAATEAPKAQSNAAAEVKGFKDLLDELAKGTVEGGKTDYAQVEKLYGDSFKKLAQARDLEGAATQIEGAIQAGKEGSLKADVVKQLVDKLGQKVLFLSVRNEFKELDANFDDKAKAKADLEDAKTYYSVLKTTVEKRDTAYQTQMVSINDGAFNDIGKSIDSGKKLDFLLAKQVIDKTLMKTFYLAAGGSKGYGYKIEKAVQEGKDPKVEQAEGWAFYQSLYSYIVKSSKEDAEWLQSTFDLKTSTKDIKGDAVKQAFVRGFAAVAKGEYAESVENFGKDKGIVTALEGALFIQVIEEDVKQLLGEADAKTLQEKAGQLVEAAKAGDKAKADPLYKEVGVYLDKLAKTGK